MTSAPTNLLLRNDTVFGICEAIGQDFGFNANWLRVALCVALFFSPVASVAAYFGLGIVVAATRFIAPDRVDTSPQPATRPQLMSKQPSEDEQRELIAA